MTTHVFDAVRDGNVEKLRQAIAEDPTCVHLNRVDVLPLMVAVREGHQDCVTVLLEAGARLNEGNEYGWTPLLEAVRQGDYDMIGLLLDYGADWEAISNRGDGIYHVATEVADATLIAQLHDWTEKSSVDRATRHGRITPLMLAVERRRLEHVDVLLSLGADPQRKNKAGATALDLAEGWPEGQAALTKVGALPGSAVPPDAAAPATSTTGAPESSAVAAPAPAMASVPAAVVVPGLSSIQKRRSSPR